VCDTRSDAPGHILGPILNPIEIKKSYVAALVVDKTRINFSFSRANAETFSIVMIIIAAAVNFSRTYFSMYRER